MLKIYNTLTRTIEEFKSLETGKVKIYVCGPTVYSYLHVGNFRGPVFFNFVRNWLEFSGYDVNYAMNFTDVEDKIIQRANDENISATEIAERYITEYKKDYAALGLRPHTSNPKVSDYMPQIISMIEDLIKKNQAYESQGDVNYSIRKFADYGKLSGRKIDDLRDGVRIDPSEKKEDPLDFALWKTAKPTENLRGSVWESPWGPGRPGWHIECSAMIEALYGTEIDIHGGGLDLMFPHHENEIAQSQGCVNHGFVKYWMHWNLFNFGGSKMSKSLGNVVQMRDFLEKQHPEVYKWIVLSVHYRSVADFSDHAIETAIGGLAKVYSALGLADSLIQSEIKVDANYQKELDQAWTEITEALNHDFGTPNAFAVMFEQIRKLNTFARRGLKTNPTVAGKAVQFKEFILKFGELLSLFQEPAEKFLTLLDDKLLIQKNLKREEVNQIVQERASARLAKDFTKSDDLRKKLTDLGITVSDLPEGSFWEVIK
jgi:cysteinyl-tRNA synthetase